MPHKSSWTDCLPLEIWLSWIVLGLLAGGVLLVSECTPHEAHAEASLDLAGGYTNFLLTAPDGDYLQKDLPHRLDLTSMAYRVGLCWHFTERWSTCGAYLNLGTVKQDANFVDDKDYNAKAGKCTANCAAAVPNKMTDAYHGGELTVTHTFRVNEDWSASLKAGGALLLHRFTIQRHDTGTTHENYGRFPATVAGVQAGFKWVYAELDYYHGLGPANCFNGCDWPLSKEMLVTWFGVKIPIGG